MARTQGHHETSRTRETSIDMSEEVESSSLTVYSEAEKWTEDKFDYLGLVATGSCMEMYIAKHKETGETVFVKFSRKPSKFKSKYLSEEYIWKKACPYPYILKLYYSYTIQTSKYFIYEYIDGGNLRNYIKVHKVLQTRIVVVFTAQLVSTVAFLHSKDIFHKEVSNREILLSRQGQIKLGSFHHALMNRTSRGIHGNLFYQAPEVFTGQIYDRTADWYSLGICLYEMVMGMTPTEYHCTRKQIDFNQLDFEGKIIVMMTTSVYIPQIFPGNLRKVLEGFLEENKEHRLGYRERIDTIKSHPFFKDIDWEEVENGLSRADLPDDGGIRMRSK